MDDFTTDYEIKYSTVTKMFEVLYRGERINWMLPSYADGENSIALHASFKDANDVAWAFANAPVTTTASLCEAGMKRAAQTVYARYPNAVFGRWNDYVTALATNTEAVLLTAHYAVIALPDGYAVHYVLPGGSLGAHVETIRTYGASAACIASAVFGHWNDYVTATNTELLLPDVGSKTQ